MADRPLQAVQDVLRVPLYGMENIHNDLSDNAVLGQYIQNMIPQFAIDQVTQSKESYLVKRPGLQLVPSSNFMTGIVNDISQCSVLDAIPITAVYDVYVIAVFDDSNDTIYIIGARPAAASYVKIGSFAPTASVDDYCFLSEITQAVAGSATPAVAVSWTNKALTASKGYYAPTAAGVFAAASLVEITSTGFPPKQTPALISIGRFVWLNGVNYIASLDGRIWNSTSNGNDITTWNAGVVAVQAYPDQCMGLERYKHHVIAFGRNSIEFFNDVGDTPGPLQPTQQAFIKFGARSPRLIKNVNDIMYWVGYGNDGASGVWMLDGYTPTKISTPNIDRAIMGTNSYGDPSTINLQATMINGIPCLVFNGAGGGATPTLPAWYPGTSPTASGAANDTYPIDLLNDFISQTPCYNLQDKTWWYFTTRTNSGIGLICAGTEFGTPVVQSNVNNYAQILLYQTVGTNKSQNFLYQWGNSLDVNKDDVGNSSDADYPSRPITTEVQMNTMWFGNEKRKRVAKFKIIGHIPYNTTDANVYSFYLFYLRNQDAIDGTLKIPSCAVRGLNFPNAFYRYYLNNLGMGRAWSFCLVEKSKQPLTLRAIELDIQQGSH